MTTRYYTSSPTRDLAPFSLPSHKEIPSSSPTPQNSNSSSMVHNLIQNFLVFPDQLRGRDPQPKNANSSFPSFTTNHSLLSQCGSIQLSSVSSLMNPHNSEVQVNHQLPSGFVLAPLRTEAKSMMQQQQPQNVGILTPTHKLLEPQPQNPLASSQSTPSHSSEEDSGSQSEEEDYSSGTMMVRTEDGDKTFINVVWIRHYEELKRFKEIHHHTNVTRTKKESRKLGNWVAEQRRKKKQGRLNRNQILLLNAAGFEWEKRKKRINYQYNSENTSPLHSSPLDSSDAPEDLSSALLGLGKLRQG